MATDLLSDGIRRFAADTEKLEKILMEKLWVVCYIQYCNTNKQGNVPFQQEITLIHGKCTAWWRGRCF